MALTEGAVRVDGGLTDMEKHMRAMVLVAVVAMAGGCGPDFDGSYDGTLLDVGQCSNGTGGTQQIAAQWTIVDAGGALTLTTGGPCDPFAARAAGNVATLTRKTCPPTTSGGVIFTSTFTGTLTLDEPSLIVSLLGETAVTGAATGSCTDRFTGTLVRRPR